MNRKIHKARAEEFIHIFVHQKAKLIEFLEHMVQVKQLYQKVSYHCFSLVSRKPHNASHLVRKSNHQNRAERVMQKKEQL